jgi:ribonuclease R
MLLRPDGSVQSSEFYPSLINSCARLEYGEVQNLLDGAAPATVDPELIRRLVALDELAKKLLRRRLERGAIEFEGVEAKVTLDEKGVPVGVRLRHKTAATSLVEEAMILANEQVAAFMLGRKAPMVYRIHDEPSTAALDELLPTLQEFGYAVDRAPQSSFEVQRVLEESAGKPEHALLSSLLLRAMKRAKYAPLFTTHFGLASRAYTHFTSPIRRYPDLMVHRLLKFQLAGVEVPACIAQQLSWLCEHSSEQEREAEQAENEAVAVKLAEYLAGRVGERFGGIITGLLASGFFVREDTTTAEGFVARTSFAEPLDYDAAHQRYLDPAANVSYRLGAPVQLVLKEVDLAQAELHFVVV